MTESIFQNVPTNILILLLSLEYLTFNLYSSANCIPNPQHGKEVCAALFGFLCLLGKWLVSTSRCVTSVYLFSSVIHLLKETFEKYT